MIKILDLLREVKQTSVLYHFTPFKGIKGILKSNSLKVGNDENFETGGNIGAISLTRDKNLNIFSYRLSLDRDKLSNNYKIKPYDWGKDRGESEEYINKDIINLKKYLISIHYILSDVDSPLILKELDQILKLYPALK